MRYKNGIKRLSSELISNHLKVTCNAYFLISLKFMNTKITRKTEKVRGYKAEFVIADGVAKGLRFNVEFPKLL